MLSIVAVNAAFSDKKKCGIRVFEFFYWEIFIKIKQFVIWPTLDEQLSESGYYRAITHTLFIWHNEVMWTQNFRDIMRII